MKVSIALLVFLTTTYEQSLANNLNRGEDANEKIQFPNNKNTKEEKYKFQKFKDDKNANINMEIEDFKNAKINEEVSIRKLKGDPEKKVIFSVNFYHLILSQYIFFVLFDRYCLINSFFIYFFNCQ